MKVQDIQLGMKVWIKNSWASDTKRHRQNGMTGKVVRLPYCKSKNVWFTDIQLNNGEIESVLLQKLKNTQPED